MNDLMFVMLKQGYSIDYGVVSICSTKGIKPRWQVYCENYKYPHAMVYEYTDKGLESAIRDFLNIKNGLEKDGLKYNKRRNKSM